MKKLNFEIPLQRFNIIEENSFNSIENFIESFSKGFLKVNVVLFSDIEEETIIDTSEFEDIKHLTNFILYYVYNILLNNAAAKQRKRSPYDINLVQKLSFTEKKFQLYIFLDDAVFGLVVGTRFKNILSLIQSIFPLIAKTDFLNEIRFFPCSREQYILGGD
jgi:hypothetical protein